MKSLSGLGLGLSLVFGCLLLAFLAEIYYLLWWKKRSITKIHENGSQQKKPDFFYISCCWKKPSSSLVHEPQSSNSNKELFQEEKICNFEDLPRFLFTITEETMEDLESEDGIIKNRTRSMSNLSDLIQIIDETPFLTPLGSPPYFTPTLTPSSFSDNYQENFSPLLFESERDAEMRCSPPPKFKFLRDAEEKLMIQTRKIMEESDVANGR